MTTIRVELDVNPYTIHVQEGGLSRLGDLARAACPHPRAAMIVDDRIADSHGEVAAASLRGAGYEVGPIIRMRASEQEKSLASVRAAYDRLLESKAERATPIISVGGGVIGDIAGFVAASYLRGVPFIQVPTTLLAMVDASIGGKTGVNITLPHESGGEEVLGKNLIGAFWQPRLVMADPATLTTLDARHFRCGLAECIKHGMIASLDHLTFVAAHQSEIESLDMNVLSKLIAASARIKATIVAADEREAGERALLNLGHTFAHAIEPIAELDLHHGEAVAIGLYAATIVSERTDRIESDEAQSMRDLIELVGLPVRLGKRVHTDRLMQAMRFDKKMQESKLRLILPIGIGQAEIVDDVDEQVIRGAWREVGAG